MRHERIALQGKHELFVVNAGFQRAEAVASLASAEFHSILFPRLETPIVPEVHDVPGFFHDLNLDQLFDTIVANWAEYDLIPFFYTPLTDLDTITYRQEIARELEDKTLMKSVASFTTRMRTMRTQLELAKKVDYKYERERWILSGIRVYCDTVEGLASDLLSFDLQSRGMQAFRSYLIEYVASVPFRELAMEATRLSADLASIRYRLLLKDNRVTVLPCDDGADLTASVEATFEKFRRGNVKDYRVDFPRSERLNHIEAQVLDRVAWLNAEIFRALDAFCLKHASYLVEPIRRFDREIHFYIAYLGFIEQFQHAGLPFCYPSLSDSSKEIESHDGFDLALASGMVSRRTAAGIPIVCNDFFLRDPERIFVVSGPNHGGKTTFARTFGQLHFLAALGCAVPGTKARLFLFDHLFAHFERAEDIATHRGRLQDDLVRVHQILAQATPRSIIIMNELFASTTLNDAVYLSRQVMAEIARLDLLAVCVTFLDELASFDEKTVSLVTAVDPHDPTIRTFKVERRPADGLAHALAIAEKYRVTYDWLKKRIRG